MSRQKTPEELAEALSFFPPGSTKTVQRLLKKAAEKEAKKARKGPRGIGGGAKAGAKLAKAIGNVLAKQLTKAMRQRGATRREQPSVKQRAPDTQGRPFHFAHSTVNKDDPAPGAKAAAGGKASGKAAAHMKYIEREVAVERADGLERAAGERVVGGARLKAAVLGLEATEREASISEDGRGTGEDRQPVEGMTSAKAGQRYIENPVKLANGENVIFSFGTIGDAFEDRVAFWERLEEAERKNARVQSRLIVELPHEATPQARYDIVKAFTSRFDEMGLPYWAALHAPGKGNDSRNFHAHIVYSETPAKRMTDPKDDVVKWDFECKDTYRTSSRHTRETRPFKQNQHPFFRPKTAMRTLRKQFEEDSNAVLRRDGVLGKDGKPVLYDARSYKDMGLDTVPMKSVDRIVADKMRSGKLTVLDGDFTKKMIRAELQEALARRDKAMMALVRLDQALDALAREPKKVKAANGRLPKEMRVSPLAVITTKVVRVAAAKVLDAKRSALSDDLMERSTRASLNRVIEATDEKVLSASASNTRDPVRRGELPSESAARLLNEAAREELRLLDVETETRKRRARYRIGLALNGWKDVVGPKLPETTPEMAVAMAEAMRATSVPAKERENVVSREAAAEGAKGKAPEPKRKVGLARIGMDAAEFNERIRKASEMTSAIFAAIGKIPDLATRQRIVDSLHPDAMAEARRQRREAADVGRDDGATTQPVAAAPASAATVEAPETDAGGQVSAVTNAAEGEATTEAQRKRDRERKKRERRAVLAKRRGGDGRGR